MFRSWVKSGVVGLSNFPWQIDECTLQKQYSVTIISLISTRYEGVRKEKALEYSDDMFRRECAEEGSKCFCTQIGACTTRQMLQPRRRTCRSEDDQGLAASWTCRAEAHSLLVSTVSPGYPQPLAVDLIAGAVFGFRVGRGLFPFSQHRESDRAVISIA